MSDIAKSAAGEYGTVLEIQRMSTEDGPGLRTTVFLKGCTLKCEWCHNPESIESKPQIQWIESRCIGCKICLDTCKKNALSESTGGIVINRQLCEGCGKCVEECPSTAMEIMGVRWSVDDLVQEVLKDRAYFENSDQGGITISGGEVTMQSRFVEQVLKKLQEENIHTAIDTCGFCKWESLERLLPYSNHLLFDLKEIDGDLHKKYTGSDNALILENVRKLADYLKSVNYETKLWLRTPIIPDATANVETVKRIADFINQHLSDVVERWDLCAFNNLCTDKYLRLGTEWKYRHAELLSQEFMETLAQTARDSLDKPEMVKWSGSTKLSTEGIKQDNVNTNSVCGC